uniref:Reverse transcriptase domain-containing protein n=1 Tax=Scylla olivacea TaxID=85551 RepID=A0A0P4W3J4_SCYOL
MFWTKAKPRTVFKIGDKLNPSNYRGISVTNSVTKVYDMVLCERLYHWFIPYREQAGAQRRRGYLEHVVTLRLLTDTALRKKIELYVAFIDFSKAYDLVPRHKMFEVLRQVVCGRMMLAALKGMYRVRESIMGSAVVAATQGVRQGFSTSCFLFVMFAN